MTTHLAFDLGATSGRAMLGTLQQGRLEIVELHRFANEMVDLNGCLHWNLLSLFQEVKAGLRACAAAGSRPDSMGIDTWGVDFGLLDRRGQLLGLPVCYRDARTEGAMEGFFTRVPRERVYELTGIQFMVLNTLYQLYALVRDDSPALQAAADLLFMPDLLNYLLTGKKATEFTFATTSQLLNPRTRQWEPELLAALGIPRALMQEIVPPGTVLGSLREAVAQEVGLQVPVVATASHDTAAAVAAVPAQGKDWAYISSGTWSLMGVESEEPILTPEALAFNITNEGGVGGFRVLKNIAGFWLLEQCRRAWGSQSDYGELLRAAESALPFRALIYPDAPEFLHPADMTEAIAGFCRRTGQRPPETPAEFVRTILESLALRYRMVLEELRRIHAHPITRLHIIGGGARNELLNQFAADCLKLPVIAGPVEATAIGNALVQAMACGEIASPAELREVVARSFPLARYEPHADADWDDAYGRFCNLAKHV